MKNKQGNKVMQNKIGLIWTGLAAAVLLQGMPVDATLIAYDGFDTSVAGDAANGVYKNGTTFSDAANNAIVGGNMVGFQSSSLWTASLANMQPLDGKGALLPSWTASVSANRALASSMTGKTVAYGSAVVSMKLNYTSTYTPSAYVGFSDETFGSRSGAGVGFQWNGSGWDVSARYRANGTWAFNDVATGYGTDTGDIFIVWKMDEANDTLSVWLNPVDENATPTVVFSDYQGEVGNIGYMNVLGSRISQTSATDGFRFDNLKLGDNMVDVIPEPTSISLFGLAWIVTLFIRRAMKR